MNVEDCKVMEQSNTLQDSINKLGEKVSALNSRQDKIEHINEKILAALESSSFRDAETKHAQEKMTTSIDKLSELLGRMQVEMARNEGTALKMIDEKLQDVYDRMNENRDMITKDYTTTAHLYKQISAVYGLVVIIAVMAWTNYTDFKSNTTIKFADVRAEVKHSKSEIQNVLAERAQRCEADIREIRDSVEEHSH